VKRLIAFGTVGRLIPILALAVVVGVAAGAVPLTSLPASGQGLATVAVQKQLVGPNNQPVMATDLSGFVFTLQPQAGGLPITMPPTNQAGQTSIGVPVGNYFIAESPRTGFTFVEFTLNMVPVQLVPVGMGTTTIVATNRVAGTGQLTVQKQLVDPNLPGVILQNVDLSGFAIQVTGPGNYNQTLTTGQNGAVTFLNLAPGNYTVTEQPRQGFTFVALQVNNVPNLPNGQIVGVQNGQNTQVIVFNRAGGTPTSVTVQTQLLDTNNFPISGDTSGFQYTLQCGTQFNVQQSTDVSGTATFNNVPAGQCTITLAARANYQLVSIVPQGATGDIGNGGTFSVPGGQPLTIAVRVRATAPPPAQTEQVQLFGGCNNVALTWAVGTPITTVAAGISPAGVLDAIWRFDNAQQRFFAYSPIPNAPIDYTMVTQRGEPVFICIRGGGTLTRPTI
jgi:hypothetical protein